MKSTSAETIFSLKPSLFYNFEDAFLKNEQVRDQSGNGRHAQLMKYAAALPRQVPGVVNQGIEFVTETRKSSPKGTREFEMSCFLSTPNPLAEEKRTSNEFTVALWFKTKKIYKFHGQKIGFVLATTIPQRHLDYTYVPRRGGWQIGTAVADLKLDSARCMLPDRTTHPEPERWNHLTVIYTGTEIQEIINGVVSRQAKAAGALKEGSCLRIGAHVYHSHFGGAMDDFILFDRALSIMEAQILYKSYE